MERQRHILVPMDDSEPARAALEQALDLFPDARLTVCHAVDDLAASYSGSPTADVGKDVNPDLFEAVATITAAHDTDVETAVLEGTPIETILGYAEENAVDHIVMGSEGRAGVSRMLLGSIAEGVARRADVPVTIVP